MESLKPLSLDALRQHESLAFLASGAECGFGDDSVLPLPAQQLAALGPGDPGVLACLDGGLTARVLRVSIQGIDYAVKQVRDESRVRNDDGHTAFLNELRRHAELAALAAQGITLPGVVRPLYGSLRHGIVVSRWIHGAPLAHIERRALTQLYASACALAEHGFFEWDYAPGNVLDDGAQTWLFDFGYMYRFDPLRQLNTAGDGTNCPQFHPAERIESRNLFGVLLATEQTRGSADALNDFALMKALAADAYETLAARLAARSAAPAVLAHYRDLAAEWRHHLASDIAPLYLRDAWRAHWHDLDDDLRGQSCTPMTIRRAEWLRAHATHDFAALSNVGALDTADAATASSARLVAACDEKLALAQRYQLG